MHDETDLYHLWFRSHSYTKSDWQMLTAAVVTNTTLRDYMITSVRKHAAAGVNSAPMSDWYDDTSGVDQGFANRPVVGAHLGLVGFCLS